MRNLCLLSFLLLSGCAKVEPRDYDKRICHVVSSNWGWSSAIHKTSKRYGISPGLILSVIYHESTFQKDARPPREMLYGVIPWRTSSAYGYGQIKKETWDWYLQSNPGLFQSRTHFSDTVNFIGWYYQLFQKKAKDRTYLARDFYFAYHEGLGGYERGSYEGKESLIKKANAVALRAEVYDQALKDCL